MKKTSILFFLSLTVLLSKAHTEKFRLTLRDNPATSIVIGWNQVSGSQTVVAYDTIDHGDNFEAYKIRHGVDRKATYHEMNNHFARLSNLKPNTTYYFMIKDSDSVSKRYWFKTAPDNNNARLSFIAGGDSRNNREPRQNGNLLVSKLKPNAVLFGGDMTDDDTAEEWINWMDDWQLTISKDGRMYPIIAARGNHEKNNQVLVDLFDVPADNVVYATQFADNLVRTYTLNSMISAIGQQSIWLQNDLESHQDVIWRLAQYHFPIRPHQSGKVDNPLQYIGWANLFYNNKVQLVVECDAHMVKTTWPIKPSLFGDAGFERDDENGTVFVGEGCWGAPLRANDDDKSWTRNSESFNQFKWIFIDKQKIELRTVKLDNATEVGEVSNENPFEMPSNIDVWNPSEGDVVVIENKSLTSIKKLDTAKEVFQLFPNPVSNTLSVVLNTEGTHQMNIYTVDGKILFKGEVSKNTKVNTSAFPSGVLNVVVSVDGKNHTQKVIKL